MSQIGKTRYMGTGGNAQQRSMVVLMFFDIPLSFAPSFTRLDLSRSSGVDRAFAMGPLAGAAIELIKILLNLVMKGSTTAGVSEVANFLIGCAYVMPAAWIYKTQKTKKNAMIGMAVGTVFLAAAGGLLNAFVLLPAYAAAFGMPMDALVGMGSAVNKAIYKPSDLCSVCRCTVQYHQRCCGITGNHASVQAHQQTAEGGEAMN